MFNDELYHYGVKGQKWGVRRFQSRDGTRTTLGKKKERENRKNSKSSSSKSSSNRIATVKKTISERSKAKETKKKAKKAEATAKDSAIQTRKKEIRNRRTLTDSDLHKKIERLKLEQQYKELATSDVSPGKQFVKKILMSAGEQALTNAAKGAMSYAIKAAMKGQFDMKEAAEYVVPPPKKK